MSRPRKQSVFQLSGKAGLLNIGLKPYFLLRRHHPCPGPLRPNQTPRNDRANRDHRRRSLCGPSEASPFRRQFNKKPPLRCSRLLRSRCFSLRNARSTVLNLPQSLTLWLGNVSTGLLTLKCLPMTQSRVPTLLVAMAEIEPLVEVSFVGGEVPSGAVIATWRRGCPGQMLRN